MNRGDENKLSGDAEHSILQINLCDDVLDSDTVFPTYAAGVTEEYETQLPVSFVSDTNISLTGTLSIG
jgi:hypothetical protein